ncbi:MAG: adenylate/guanylate cyclase domain-containing protein [Bacteroidia bacterium]
MKKTLCILITSALLALSVVKAQDRNAIDSLKTVLKTAIADTAKAKAYKRLAEEYRELNLDSCIYYNEMAIDLSKKSKDKFHVAGCLNAIGKSYDFFGNKEKALQYFLESMKESEQINTGEGKFACMVNYLDIATVYDNLSDHEKALEFRKKALGLFHEIKDNPKEKKEVEQNKGLIEDESDWIMIEGGIYDWLGKNYVSLGKNDSALFYFDKAEKIWEETGIEYLQMMTIQNKSALYINKHELDKALKNYFKMLEFTKRDSSYWPQTMPLSGIGTVYNYQRKYDEAIKIFKEILSKQIRNKSFDYTQNAYQGLSEAYKGKNDYKTAYLYRDTLLSNIDSIASQENKKNIAAMKVKFETSEKEKQIKILEQENKLKDLTAEGEKLTRRFFIGGIFFLICLSGLLYNRYRLKNNANIIITKEKQRSDDLLLNILPSEVAEELKSTGAAKAKAFTMVTVMFTDFKDFTTVSEKVSAELLVAEIHYCFSAFDNIIQKYKIEKIKTIGDAYLCASGLPVSNHTHAEDMLNAAFEIRNFMLGRKKEKEAKGEIPFELRIGINTGSVVAGIVGIKKYAYDIWGDTVNLATRMEQNSEAGKINISGSTYELVKDKFKCEHRGKIDAKNKGMIDMYFVEA